VPMPMDAAAPAVYVRHEGTLHWHCRPATIGP
jgi:hypothetical protein